MYTLLNTGDVPGASTWFNPLLQQTVLPTTSGGRMSPSHEGMTIHESDTNAYAKWTGSAWEYWGSSRTSFTPVLTVTSGTNPTLGSGSSSQGWWAYLPGGSVLFTFKITFGTSGVAAGTGNYAISTPIVSANPFGTSHASSYGSLILADSSSGGFRVGTCFVPGNALQTLGLVVENSTIVTNAAPWVWAASDYLAGSIIYPI